MSSRQQVAQALMRLAEREGSAAASGLLDEVFFAAADALPPEQQRDVEQLADRLAQAMVQGGPLSARHVVLAVGFHLVQQGPPGPRRTP